jgi:hypothetical protein
VLRPVASLVTLLVSPGSPATSTGFHQPLALQLAKHNSRDKDSKAQTRTKSNQFSFVVPIKIKPPELYKCNIDVFFT